MSVLLFIYLLAAPGAVSPVGASAPQGRAATPAAVNLAGVRPGKFDRGMAGKLEAYVTDLMRRAQVPGAAVAVVQDGRTVYAKGFGVRELVRPAYGCAI